MCPFLTLLFLGALLFRPTISSCVFTQDPAPQPCNASDPNGPLCCAGGGPPSEDGSMCVPRPINSSMGEGEPHLYTGSYNVCGFDNVCCSDTQMFALAVNGGAIFSTFGDVSSAGGCPACYQNRALHPPPPVPTPPPIPRAGSCPPPPPRALPHPSSVLNFWCQFTCSPNQSSFVRTLGYEKRVDPISMGPVTVQHTVVNVTKQFACGTFSSCAATGHVKEETTLQNCESFFVFQGETEAISTGHMFIDFAYTDNITATGRSMDQPLYSCCNFNLSLGQPIPLGPLPPPAPGAANVSCPCASCSGMCAGGSCAGAGGDDDSLSEVNVDTLNGFNGVTVGAFWGSILVVGATVLVSRRMLGCEKRPLSAVDGVGGCERGVGATALSPAWGTGDGRKQQPLLGAFAGVQ
jgi:hypothetical protein